MKGAISGLRVLESSVQLAGPYCGRLLGELGAEVIKVEPPGGEASRRSPPFFKGTSLSYLYWNANKKSLALNLKVGSGKNVFLDLANKSDIVVSNYRAGVMERLGLGYKELRKLNQRIIYASITGFGSYGPLSNNAGYDMIAQAMSGLADANMCPDGSPKINSMSLDYSAAMMAVIGILAALYHREKTGEGQSIDISLQDVGLVYGQHLIGQHLCGMNYRSGNRRQAFAPFSVYKTSNGHSVIAIDEDRRWEAFLTAIGKGDLARDPKFVDVGSRVKNYDDVDKLILSWTQNLDTDEVVRVVTKAGGASCAVKTMPEVLGDEHLKERNMIGEIDYSSIGKVPYIGSTLKMSATPGNVESLGPIIGADTDYVLKDLLGYSEEQLKELRESGAVA
ncbi:MAG: CaiB/BaiF CoA transferase family protein [Nitrososphaerales archaeon]